MAFLETRIRELVEGYAHCADRRDAKGQMALFTADTHFPKAWAIWPTSLAQPMSMAA